MPTIWSWPLNKPFGDNGVNEDVDGDGKTFTLNLWFPGQYYDRETGLSYNYYRDYGPSLGRYVESDPIGLIGGTNTFSYALVSPIIFTDSSGNDADGLPHYGADESASEYYMIKCAKTGCGYYCYVAPHICLFANPNLF